MRPVFARRRRVARIGKPSQTRRQAPRRRENYISAAFLTGRRVVACCLENEFMNDPIPMTRDGFNRKKAELDRLQNEEMPKIAEKIAEARRRRRSQGECGIPRPT